MNAIYFDMDGTIADLYNVECWEYKLNHEDVSPYADALPLCDMQKLNALLVQFQNAGITIGVITWSAMNGSKEYNKATRKAKRQWIKNNLPVVSEFHCVKYGTPKHRTAKVKDSILIDDNEQVCKAWKNGTTIDPRDTKKMIKSLEKLLTNLS